MKSLLRKLIAERLPERYRLRLVYTLLRSLSGEHRAVADLLVPPFDRWIPWNSGLEEAMHVLYGVCRALKPEAVVEIGSARGYSTCALGLACMQNGRGKLYAIDPHDPNPFTEGGGPEHAGENYEFFLSRLEDYGLTPRWVEVIRASSTEAARGWDRPIDFLFIDGDHRYEAVKADFETFRPWLRDHSLVAFHDSMWGYRRRHEPDPDIRHLGVSVYLDELREEGYQAVSINVGAGLTLLCPFPGGISLMPEFWREREQLASRGT